VLFPLVGGEDVRAGSGVYGSAQHLRAVTLLSRTVLHNFERLARLDEFYIMWLKLVGILTTLLRRRPGDNTYGGGLDSAQPRDPHHDAGANADNSMNSMDASISLDTTARESLKNLLLVAHHSGLLEQISEDGGASPSKKQPPARDIWGPTWALVGSVSLPLCQEIERATRPVSPNAVGTGVGTAAPTLASSQPEVESGARAPSVGVVEPRVRSVVPAVVVTGVVAGSVAPVGGGAEQGMVPPILELDIKLAGGSSAALAVRPGDVPQDVARKFAEQHNLSLEKQQKLTRVIEASLAVPQ
jgi:hypothetical protein